MGMAYSGNLIWLKINVHCTYIFICAQGFGWFNKWEKTFGQKVNYFIIYISLVVIYVQH